MYFKTDEATQNDILKYLELNFPSHKFRVDIQRNKISICAKEYTLHYTLQSDGSIKDSVEFWSFTYSTNEIFIAAREAEKVHYSLCKKVASWFLMYNAVLIINS